MAQQRLPHKIKVAGADTGKKDAAGFPGDISLGSAVNLGESVVKLPMKDSLESPVKPGVGV
jgi:hypothetical protein